MAEWLYEAGIGEARAALVEDGMIVEAIVEPEDGGVRCGTIVAARLVERLSPTLGRVEWPGGAAMLDRPPPATTLGATLIVAIVREAIPEERRTKLPKAIVAPEGALPAPAPDLLARIAASGIGVRRCRPHEPDRFEAAGWSEILDQAETGEVAFPGGILRIATTPAMTVIDVDGTPPLGPLSRAAADAAGRTIRQLDLAGSIGIDFPTLANKAERQAVAEALDAALPPPFERTAINGFGFLQLIRPRRRPSLIERIQADPVGAAARAALRRLERTPPGQPAPVRLPPALVERIDRAGWRAELIRRTGTDLLEPPR